MGDSAGLGAWTARVQALLIAGARHGSFLFVNGREPSWTSILARATAREEGQLVRVTFEQDGEIDERRYAQDAGGPPAAAADIASYLRGDGLPAGASTTRQREEHT